ncbi:hypothetical protein HN51_057840 [Arachis hypogaea]|uniref:DUF506 family protein n=1 Tax=Arachis hypogaea TaxID=3818 RepID=A0A444WYK5_ARAHY|nr:uncharacterized protein LOC107624081 [Arachis ipaensis]XP_025680480.1 uncharacterized protein LOC112782340 [Arachis hypogaea]QHN80956.1 uncharacterized protein DS421_20g682680 [Arachis hypogaea]RYQ82475.1 hypothetical protein Ahy_B10g101064 [Arachis hypogaea]
MGGTTMGGRVTRFLSSRRRVKTLEFSYVVEQPQHETSCVVGDVEFEFLDDANIYSACSSDDSNEIELDQHHDDDQDNDDDTCNLEDNRTFWDNQHQILQANVCRTSSLESRIRHATKEALQEIQSEESVCGCGREMAAATSCRSCLMREVSRRLQKAGFDSAICKTKWRSSPDIPSGEHKFLDVIDTTSSKKGEVIRVMIELNFRAEFEMARGSEDYNRLVRRLPEVFVGKVERLTNLIKILCMAAKRCMKEKKMHMGPWRKHRYMQAKWLGPCERNTSTTPLLSSSSSMGYSQQSHRIIPKPKPRASMLTVDLLDKLSTMHCTAVEVL